MYKEKRTCVALINIEDENKIVEELKDPETKKILATIVRELMGDTLVEVTFRLIARFYFMSNLEEQISIY